MLIEASVTSKVLQLLLLYPWALLKKPHYEPHGETRSKNTVVNKREYIQNSAINVSEILNIFPNFRNKIKLGKLNN